MVRRGAKAPLRTRRTCLGDSGTGTIPLAARTENGNNHAKMFKVPKRIYSKFKKYTSNVLHRKMPEEG